MRACGERAWHSRKVLLPSTPYCTISRVFLLAAGTNRQTDRSRQTLSQQPQTVITLNSQQPKPRLWQIIIPHSNYQRDAGTQWLRPTRQTEVSAEHEAVISGTRSLSQSSCLVGRHDTSRRKVVSPLELNPRHWRMGFPYLTSCRRLRLKGSDQCCQIRREKNHKATASHSKPFDKKKQLQCSQCKKWIRQPNTSRLEIRLRHLSSVSNQPASISVQNSRQPSCGVRSIQDSG